MKKDREACEAWDRNAEFRFYELVGNNDTAYDEICRWVLKSIGDRCEPGGRVLDAGCGTGVLSGWIADHGYDVVGVDPSSSSIDRARKFTPRIDFLWDTLERFAQTSDEKFDVVVANMVLHTVSDLESFLRAARSCVKKGGVLVVVMPHPQSYLQSRSDFDVDGFSYGREQLYWLRFRINGGDLHPAKTPYIHRPLAKYEEALASCGFAIEEREEPVRVGRGRERDLMFLQVLAV